MWRVFGWGLEMEKRPVTGEKWEKDWQSYDTSGRNINNRYTDDTTLMAESKEELKSLLMKVKEDSEKAGLKLTFKKWKSWPLIPSLHGK